MREGEGGEERGGEGEDVPDPPPLLFSDNSHTGYNSLMGQWTDPILSANWSEASFDKHSCILVEYVLLMN